MAALAAALVLASPGVLPAKARPAVPTSGPPSTIVTVRHPITRGNSLSSILTSYGQTPGKVDDWARVARPLADLRRLHPGRHLLLTFEDGVLRQIRYRYDKEHDIVIEHRNGYRARREAIPVLVRVEGARVNIEGNFYRSATKAGIPEPVISKLVDLLGWQMDFTTEVRAGDTFRVLYEHRTGPDGEPLSPGRIVAAEYKGKVRNASVFLYSEGRDESGEDLYLNADGRTVEPGFLKYPVEFTRITSTFSHSRFHPILKKRRPHLGVDFAAPSGTPVRAIGSGRVRWAGWRGHLGRHIEIDHGDGVITTYSHLRDIEPFVRTGKFVHRGQVVGRVGQTGLATGPHLHFAMFKNGRYVNPLTSRMTPRVVSVDRKRFQRVHARLDRELRAIPGNFPAIFSTRPIVLSTLGQARQFRLGALTM